MIKIVKKTVYVSTDGMEHATLREAHLYETAHVIERMLSASDMYFPNDGVSPSELGRWIADNLDAINGKVNAEQAKVRKLAASEKED